MILFYNKKSLDIISTINGRVFYKEHLKVSISISGIPDEDIAKIIIGYVEDDKGKRTENNLHLWQHQLEWENPINPKKAIKQKVVLDEKGNVISFKDKSEL